MTIDIVRAWKDEGYRKTLGEEAPDSPAGEVVSDEELAEVRGGQGSPNLNSFALACLQTIFVVNCGIN